MTTVRYSADNSEIRLNIGATGAAGNFTGAWTIALLCRRRATGGFSHVMSHNLAAGPVEFGLEFTATNTLGCGNDANMRTATLTMGTTDWYLVVVTKAAGTQIPTLSYKNITTGSAWTHTTFSGTVADSASQSGGTVRFGEWADADDANYNVAVNGGWNSALVQTDREALATNLRTSDWTGHAVAPSYVHEQISNVTIPDLMGNGVTLNVVNGTTTEAVDPPGWTFDGSGGGAVYTPRRELVVPEVMVAGGGWW